MNRALKELYEKASFPVATVDRDCCITWANPSACQRYPALFCENGLQALTQLPDDRDLFVRCYQNQTAASFRPRQAEYRHLCFTLSPLPNQRELLVIVAEENTARVGSEGYVRAVSSYGLPALRSITGRLLDGLDAVRAGCLDLPHSVRDGLEEASRCCSEFLCVSDHFSLFSQLSDTHKARFTLCDTSGYFRELLAAVRQILGDQAPKVDIQGEYDLVLDHDLVGRTLLILLGITLEFGTEEPDTRILLTDEEMTLTVSVKVPPETNEEYIRSGLGLSVVEHVVALHKGTCSACCEDGHLSIVASFLSGKNESPLSVDIRSDRQYISDRFSMVYLEMDKFAHGKRSNGKSKGTSL